MTKIIILRHGESESNVNRKTIMHPPETPLTNKGKKQARRNRKAEPVVALRWRKSWNWGFLLLPVLLAAQYLGQIEQIMPIRSIQLVGEFFILAL